MPIRPHNISHGKAGTTWYFNYDQTTENFVVRSSGSTTMLYVDGTNNRVGIGKTPSVAFDVAGAAAFGSTVSFGGALTVTTGGLTVTAGGLTVTAGGATITAGGLTVTAGGETITAGGLGIGAAAPAVTDANVQSTQSITITGGVTDGYCAGVHVAPTYTAASSLTVTRHNYFDLNNPVIGGSAALTDACVFRFDAAAGTHKAVDGSSSKSSPGTVSAWVKINVNGTIYFMPAYTSKTS